MVADFERAEVVQPRPVLEDVISENRKRKVKSHAELSKEGEGLLSLFSREKNRVAFELRQSHNCRF
jgi:hypothetical protein